jgi:hypothetical protein
MQSRYCSIVWSVCEKYFAAYSESLFPLELAALLWLAEMWYIEGKWVVAVAEGTPATTLCIATSFMCGMVMAFGIQWVARSAAHMVLPRTVSSWALVVVDSFHKAGAGFLSACGADGTSGSPEPKGGLLRLRTGGANPRRDRSRFASKVILAFATDSGGEPVISSLAQ